MTNITEKKNKSDMRLHIVKAFEIIEEHLPESYVALVKEKLTASGDKFSANVIRNVRIKKPEEIRSNHFAIVNAMVEVAKHNKLQKEKLIENLSE
ncbi:hypothetical protein ACI6PS_02350 [Flavobacterium sp. PLA-1-15]|uniref:hypothetical protein n=1 Tax=Flavobacterium sp. PLA-1-15 TaxID=3380533 RepID=UPI003B7CEC82